MRDTSNGIHVAERHVEDMKAATGCGDSEVPGALLAGKVLRAEAGLGELRDE